jgi:hypothetical protein
MTCFRMFGFVQSLKMLEIDACWKTITLGNIEDKPKKIVWNFFLNKEYSFVFH